MKPSDVDWNDPASRFAYSDWLEERGKLLEAEVVRGQVSPPVELPIPDSYGDGVVLEDQGDGLGYGEGTGDGIGEGKLYKNGLGFNYQHRNPASAGLREPG